MYVCEIVWRGNQPLAAVGAAGVCSAEVLF